jgi:hypothetical protein
MENVLLFPLLKDEKLIILKSLMFFVYFQVNILSTIVHVVSCFLLLHFSLDLNSYMVGYQLYFFWLFISFKIHIDGCFFVFIYLLSFGLIFCVVINWFWIILIFLMLKLGFKKDYECLILYYFGSATRRKYILQVESYKVKIARTQISEVTYFL